jgi:hypothetical protein
MLSFKLKMKKYLTLIYIGISLMAGAQFKENTFDNQSNQTVQNSSDDDNTFEMDSHLLVSLWEESTKKKSNPGEAVPINGVVPVLLLTGMALLAYFYKKNKSLI